MAEINKEKRNDSDKWGYAVCLGTIITFIAGIGHVNSFGLIYNDFINDTHSTAKSLTTSHGVFAVMLAVGVYLESEKTLTSCPRYEWPCGDTQTSPARAPAPDPRHVTAPRGGRARPIPRTSDPELWPALSKLGISPVSTVWEMLATRPAETPVGTGEAPCPQPPQSYLQLRARRV